MRDESMKLRGGVAPDGRSDDGNDGLDDLELQSDHELDLRVIRVLETGPAVRISADFAARVAGRAPVRRGVVVKRTHFGYGAMILSVVALFAALVLLAADTRYGAGHPTMTLSLETPLLAQLTGLAVWLSARRWGALGGG